MAAGQGAHGVGVENDPEVIAPLIKVVFDGPNPLAKLHAMCVLDGMTNPDPAPTLEDTRALIHNVLIEGLKNPEPGVRTNAIRLIQKQIGFFYSEVPKLADDPDVKVRMQLALSIGEWPAAEK